MPWGIGDAQRHTHAANSPKRKRQWAEIADKVLGSTGDEGRAIRDANSAVKKPHVGARRKKRS